MPKPIQIDLDSVNSDPERAEIVYADKEVLMKMFSIKKSLATSWISEMREMTEFREGVLNPSYRTVLIKIDTFEKFCIWKSKNRYKVKKEINDKGD